jgi:hypothetical protein
MPFLHIKRAGINKLLGAIGLNNEGVAKVVNKGVERRPSDNLLC